MNAISLQIEDGIYSLWATLQKCGEDWTVTICGGTKNHIGAVALGAPYPSLRGDGTTSASVSILCVPGHKDDEIADDAARELASTFDCHVAASVGIHIDRAKAEDIQRLWNNYRILMGKIKGTITAARAFKK